MDIKVYNSLRRLILVGMEVNGWAKEKILTGGATDFLEYILPKTKEKAAQQLAIEMACLDHDENILTNRFHLFRLPPSLELQLSHSATEPINDQNFIPKLEYLCANIATETQVGPVNIGSASELADEAIAQCFAKHYLEAFKSGYKTYPYLT